MSCERRHLLCGPDKAVLLLSGRYLSDDQFWFSFFHEAGHLVLHWDADLLILETSDGPMSPQEDEANKFATEQLIPLAFRCVYLQLRSRSRAS